MGKLKLKKLTEETFEALLKETEEMGFRLEHCQEYAGDVANYHLVDVYDVYGAADTTVFSAQMHRDVAEGITGEASYVLAMDELGEARKHWRERNNEKEEK